MPLKKCQDNGKDGWKWGDQGHCYTGEGAKEKAIKNGMAIEGPDKFAEMMHEESKQITKDIGEYLNEDSSRKSTPENKM